MKLLYFTIQIHFLGGLSRIVIEKINWLVAHGYEVSLCNIEELDVKPAYPIDPKVKLIRGDISTTPGNACTRMSRTIAAVKRVKEIIKEENPDIILNAHCPLVTWIVPFITFSGNLSLFRKKNRIPTIMEMHQSRQGLEVFNKRYFNGFTSWLHSWSTRWIYGKYTKFVSLTSEDKDAWNIDNCIVIPNFTSMNPSDKEEETNKKEHQIILLTRLMPQKRVDLMIRVWAKIADKYPDWHVKVLGEGLLRPELEQLTKDLGVQESFFMPGSVSDVTAELEASDIMCLTSEHEGLCLVLIEAMLKSVPVMAFEIMGIHDVIEDGYNGYLVPFGDVDAYAKRLSEMIESKNLRNRFQKNGKEFVKRFDKERIMNVWHELFLACKK